MTLRNLIAFLFVILLINGCAESKEGADAFKTVQIGNQIWMAENLNVATFRNGEPIPEVKTQQEWVQAGEKGQPAWCHFNNDPAHSAKYGRLYNWYAATDARGLAPEGWHVPSDEEWTYLSNQLGGDVAAGVKLKSQTTWTSGAGNNSSGFNVLAGGGRGGTSQFKGQGSVAVFWSTTPKSRSFAYYRVLHASKNGFYREDDDKMSGFAVRCVRDLSNVK